MEQGIKQSRASLVTPESSDTHKTLDSSQSAEELALQAFSRPIQQQQTAVHHPSIPGTRLTLCIDSSHI